MINTDFIIGIWDNNDGTTGLAMDGPLYQAEIKEPYATVVSMLKRARVEVVT